ncbi:hypothetical protein ACF0H5_000998 [Mactra antiquata]
MKILGLFVTLCLFGEVVSFNIPQVREDEDNICCVPQEWEAKMFLNYGMVFIDSNTMFDYFNATVHAAYSFPKKKVYFHVKGTESSPLFPKPNQHDMILLHDFENMQSYNVEGGDCSKIPIETNMIHQCIPRDAKHISDGIVGYGNTTRIFHTYQYKSDVDIPFTTTASVFINDASAIEPKTCHPSIVHYFSGNPGDGSLYHLEFLDIGGLKTKTIFDIPKPCL